MCMIDSYSKHAWLVPLKEKNVLQLLMLFKTFLDESKSTKHKPNKIWVDKGN